MLLIPAIVLKDGRCEGTGVTPGTGPAPAEALRVADAWVAGGAQRLHVTDGAAGQPAKLSGVEVIQALAEAHPQVSIQVAGNFRDGDAVGRYLGAGAEFAILDAKVATTPHFVNDMCLEYPGHILMTLEARSASKATAGGWSKMARHPLEETARRFQQEGVAGVLYRAMADAEGAYDIVPAVALARALTIPVLVSTGLKSLAAVTNFCEMAQGLAGAILEAAYRSEASSFSAAVSLAERVPVAE